MKSRPLILITIVCLLLFPASTLSATQTENNVLHILPAPGPVVIDGKIDDWDLSGGLFACEDVERVRDKYSVSFYAMYDAKNIYLLAKVKDKTPLNNDQSSKGGHGFAGDCIQVRFITGYKTPEEKVSHWTAWRDRDGIGIIDVAFGRKFNEGSIPNALDKGAQQAFLIDADGKGYAQEIAIPWALLTKSGQPLLAGDSLRLALEPNFTADTGGRVNIHDIFLAGVPTPDRVFTFTADDQWGMGLLEKSGHIQTPNVRLTDGREFPLKVDEHGYLVSDWTGLIKSFELPGFKDITFTTPADGYVSLHIKNSQGEVVRQLLNENFFTKGEHTVKWDGVTSPMYQTPGNPVEAGQYTWEGITHPAFNLTLRGWAGSSGCTPWDNGGVTNWGADHGLPDAVAVEGDHVYLGWSGAEGGKALLGCDLDGNVVWRVGTGLAGNVQHIAIDGPSLYTLGWNGVDGNGLTRMRTRDGVFDTWEGRDSAAIDVPDLWVDQADKASLPKMAAGIAAKDGKIYLPFSDEAIYRDSISDWKAFATKLTDGDPLHQRIFAMIDPYTTERLKGVLADPNSPKDGLQGNWRNFANEAVNALNKLLLATDLVPGTDKMGTISRAETNRKLLEASFDGLIQPTKTNFIAICDGKTAKLIKMIPAPYPGALHLIGENKVGFVSDGTSLQILNPQSGEVKPWITGLKDATNFAVDADGKIYVTVTGSDQQVKIFAPDGRPAGAIGRDGGRALLGKWQSDGMYNPVSVTVDNQNHRVWVAEPDFHPKRISVWNQADGKFVKEFYGASHYGSSGGAIDPLDPNIMVGEGCEWKMDPTTGRSVCTGVYDRNLAAYAVFCQGANKHLYLAVVSDHGVDHGACSLDIFERVGEGDYKLRSQWTPDYKTQTTTVWSDTKGDGQKDPADVTTLPYLIQVSGWLSLAMNPTDFTLFGVVPQPGMVQHLTRTEKPIQTVFQKIYRINPSGFTACGAPKWDLEKMQELPYLWDTSMEEGPRELMPSPDNHFLLTQRGPKFECFDLTTEKKIWTYPNPFGGVQGSHPAPPPVPGLTEGAFGPVGVFQTPQSGTVWAINGNCGEWFLFTEKGYYLGHLFQGDNMQVHYPDKAVPGVELNDAPCGSGSEAFGGSLTQGTDGQVYIQTGANALWNVLATGFDQVTPIGGGQVEIKPEEIDLARQQQEAQLQVASGVKTLDVKTLTPTFTGDLNKDFKGVDFLSFQKEKESAVRTAMAWDTQNLYLAWEVTDNTPWINGATEPGQMYLNGDTVDFQFGSDPKANPRRSEAVAGDFRISIGNFQGKATAMLYRPVSSQKKPMSFTSGVIAHYEMDYVDQIADANLKVTIRPGKGYLVEAAIPWTSLDFVPVENTPYRGDLGATHGNEGGTRTGLRTYWSNQETGLVADAVFEVKLVPRNWGNLVFQK